MPKASKTPTTTRRALALGSGAFVAIGLTAGAAATTAGNVSARPSAAASPEIRERWARYTAVRDELNRADSADPGLRDRLVARWGEIPRGSSGAEHWGHDPDQAVLTAQIHECDRLCGIEAERLEDFLAYPASSVADLAYKLAAVLDVWRQHEGLDEFHELIALSFFRDAERALQPLLPADFPSIGRA